ncbi:MAG: BON domain-containing protein [Ktedonobacterales bacterium]
MAISRGSGTGSFHDTGNPGIELPRRQILRFGAKIKGDDVPSVPLRYRGLDGPNGKLAGVRLLPATGDLWLRLVRMDRRPPFERSARTIPLNARQSPAPSSDAIELRGGMRAYCDMGYIGRMEGVTFDTSSGVALELILHVRSDVLADVETSTRLVALLPVAGRTLLISPAWASSVKPEPSSVPFRGEKLTLRLDASPEQIASGTALRRDEEVAGDIWDILDANPAIAPYTARLQVEVHDGAVRLSGTLPTPRHRASAEQDIWHVPGVFGLYDETTIGD